jgi:hypothetical protein
MMNGFFLRTKVVLPLLAMVLCACSAVDQRDDGGDGGDGLTPLLEDAGEPVRRVYIGSFIRDWQVVNGDTVLMEFDRQRRVFVQLGPPCSSVIDEVTAIELMPNHAGYLSVFDQIRAGDMVCRIEGMRPAQEGSGGT